MRRMNGPDPERGFGLGLRVEHYEAILAERPAVDWFEALTENYLVAGGKPLHYLDRVREHYPLSLHGVSLSIGNTTPLNFEYLSKVKALAARIEPDCISDHLCWTGTTGRNLHDLLPLPYTEEALQHVASRVRNVQDYLGRQILLENVSSYVTFKDSRMTEWEFLRAVAEESDCLILLDVNNVYVSGMNHGFDPQRYLQGLPSDRIAQIHLAGHRAENGWLIDTHDQPVADAVWSLYLDAVSRFGQVPTSIERDANIPSLAELEQELSIAREMTQQAIECAA